MSRLQLRRMPVGSPLASRSMRPGLPSVIRKFLSMPLSFSAMLLTDASGPVAKSTPGCGEPPRPVPRAWESAGPSAA